MAQRGTRFRSARKKPRSDQGGPKETLQEYLIRGGKITKVVFPEPEEVVEVLRVKKNEKRSRW